MPMTRSVFSLWLFAFVCSSCLYLFTLDLELGHINRLIKGTPIVLLMTLAWVSSQFTVRRFLMTALCFSLLGDILLSFDGLFIIGLAAFLVAQLTYTGLFLKYKQTPKHFRFWCAFILIYIIAMASIVLPKVMSSDVILGLIVAVYMCAISTMAISAGLRTHQSVYITALGAFIFVISDSLIAINKFVAPFDYSGIAIMVSYYAAQLFIVLGVVNNRNAQYMSVYKS